MPLFKKPNTALTVDILRRQAKLLVSDLTLETRALLVRGHKLSRHKCPLAYQYVSDMAFMYAQAKCNVATLDHIVTSHAIACALHELECTLERMDDPDPLGGIQVDTGLI